MDLPDIDLASERRLLVQADVEPDADQDGKGDVTQDRADLVLTGSAPAAVGNLEPWSMSYTIRNAGPDAALDVVLQITGGGVAPGAAPAGMPAGTVIRAAPAVPSAASSQSWPPAPRSAVSPSFITPAIYPPLGGTFATQATVDRDHARSRPHQQRRVAEDRRRSAVTLRPIHPAHAAVRHQALHEHHPRHA